MSLACRAPLRARLSLGLRALPRRAELLHERLAAPAELCAHHLLVHDLAERLREVVEGRWPALALDSAALALGAATHDIGKALHPEELRHPSERHRRDGRSLLLAKGIDAPQARFAADHGLEAARVTGSPELALVAAADQLWRGARDAALEERIAGLIALGCEQPLHAVQRWLQAQLALFVGGAERRLAWQASFRD